MKKKNKTFKAFLLLFALITIIKPIHLPVDVNNEPEISVCGDDETSEDVIRAE